MPKAKQLRKKFFQKKPKPKKRMPKPERFYDLKPLSVSIAYMTPSTAAAPQPAAVAEHEEGTAPAAGIAEERDEPTGEEVREEKKEEEKDKGGGIGIRLAASGESGLSPKTAEREAQRFGFHGGGIEPGMLQLNQTVTTALKRKDKHESYLASRRLYSESDSTGISAFRAYIQENIHSELSTSNFYIKDKVITSANLLNFISENEKCPFKQSLLVDVFIKRNNKNIAGKFHKYTFSDSKEFVNYLRIKNVKKNFFIESKTLKLDVINVGQGSASLLRHSRGSSEKEALFQDLGTDVRNIDEFIKNTSLDRKADKSFDVIFSHGHADHTAGRDVSSSAQAAAHISSEMSKKTPDADYSFNILATGSHELKTVYDKIPEEPPALTLADSFDLTPAFKPGITPQTESLKDYITIGLSEQGTKKAPDSSSKYNEDSSMLKASFGDIDFILPGDALADDVSDFIDDSDAAVLVSSHHGSKTGNTPEILRKAEEVLISAKEGNSYGLPSAEGLFKDVKGQSRPDGSPAKITGKAPLIYSTANMGKSPGSIVVKSAVYKIFKPSNPFEPFSAPVDSTEQLKAVYTKKRDGQIVSESRYGDGGRTRLLNILRELCVEYGSFTASAEFTEDVFMKLCFLETAKRMTGKLSFENDRFIEPFKISVENFKDKNIADIFDDLADDKSFFDSLLDIVYQKASDEAKTEVKAELTAKYAVMKQLTEQGSSSDDPVAL